MLSEDDRRKRRRIWLSGSAALLALAAACGTWAALRIPRDIADRTLAALQTAGLDPRAAVSVDGRTVILSGEVPDAYTRARMRAIAGSIRGVHAVRDRLAVAPLPSEPLQPSERGSPPPETEPSPAADRPARPAAANPAPPELRAEALQDSRPLMDNHSRKGRAMNRRVELILSQ